jgi:uncharacterized UPF0146 family protein
MGKKNFIEENKSTIKFVAIGVGSAFVVYKLLQKLGLIATQKDVDNSKLIDSYSNNSVLQIQTPPINTGDLLNEITLKSMYDNLIKAHGFFNDNEDLVYSTFRMLKNKKQLEQFIKQICTAI